VQRWTSSKRGPLPRSPGSRAHYRYLTSYPYLTSGPLHTYAGLLSFFLAQPVSQRLSAEEIQGRAASVDSTSTSSPPRREASNASMIRSARAWFTKAAELDGKDDVAREFLRLVSLYHYSSIKLTPRLTIRQGVTTIQSSMGKTTGRFETLPTSRTTIRTLILRKFTTFDRQSGFFPLKRAYAL